MRILLITWGSRGDCQPFLALGRSLAAAGHAVTLGGPGHMADAVAAAGLPFVAAGPSFTIADLETATARMVAGRNPLAGLRVLVQDYLCPGVVATYQDLLPQAAEADVLVSHFVQPAGAMLAERLGRPLATVTFQPHALPSRDYPPDPTWPNLGGGVNRLLWAAGRPMLRRVADVPINAARAELGFAPLRDVFYRSGHSSALSLVAVSPAVFPRPSDWPDAFKVPGSFVLPPPADYVPDAALAAFLAAGPPPVVIGFGSMTLGDSAAVSTTLVEAVRRSGVRAVLQAGWADLGADLDHGHIHVAGDVPHDWLFPRAAAVVHHGGSGTTAAVLRAGVPQVIVAHIADQPAWAATMVQQGVSPGWVHRRDLGAARLAQLITAAVTEPSYRERAAALGLVVRAEDGVGTAVGWIERLGNAGR
jgi:UDP:flavonoid glycosyltransferase YjiC (YdhE family)